MQIGSIKKASSYNGTPCYEISENAVTVSGFGNANNVDNLPPCQQLRNAALTQAPGSTSTNFDPVTWIKENPLYAGAAAIAIYLLLKK